MQLIVIALATWQIVEIWHHSVLMAPLRARADLLTGKIGDLLGCPFCLSVWVGMFCAASSEIAYVADRGGSLILLGFAASRLANLGNDICSDYCRTPKFRIDIDE